MYIEEPEEGAQPIRVSRTMWLLILGPACDNCGGRAVREAVGGGCGGRCGVDFRGRVRSGGLANAIVHGGSVAQ